MINSDVFKNLLIITRNMGQDGDGHAHFDQIWRPNITINYMGEHRGKTSAHASTLPVMVLRT